jgi:hypothetical protein
MAVLTPPPQSDHHDCLVVEHASPISEHGKPQSFEPFTGTERGWENK